MTNHANEALDTPIDIRADEPTSAPQEPGASSQPRDAKAGEEPVVDTLLKEGADAPDAADIEDPEHQI